MQPIDFSAAIADLDQQISQAADYLKKLRKHKRQLAKIQAEKAAIAQLNDGVNTATEDSACEQNTAIADTQPVLQLVPAVVATPAPMGRDALRKACQRAGIKWRNGGATGKHLTVSEMQAALASFSQAA